MAVPYAHMTLVAITKRMSEPEVQKLFGQGMATAPPAAAEGTPTTGDTADVTQAAVESEASALEPAGAATPAPLVVPEPPAKSKTAPPSKSVRTRTASRCRPSALLTGTNPSPRILAPDAVSCADLLAAIA